MVSLAPGPGTLPAVAERRGLLPLVMALSVSPTRTGTRGRTSVSSAATPSPRRPISTCTCARTQARSPSSATSAGRPSAPKVRRAPPLPGPGRGPAAEPPRLSPCLVPTASLDKHNRTHTGERPFSCEFCEQRFTEKGPLLRHVASRHQEGRPHFCQICGKTFKGTWAGGDPGRAPWGAGRGWRVSAGWGQA